MKLQQADTFLNLNLEKCNIKMNINVKLKNKMQKNYLNSNANTIVQ
jgi:hypothetical protein